MRFYSSTTQRQWRKTSGLIMMFAALSSAPSHALAFESGHSGTGPVSAMPDTAPLASPFSGLNMRLPSFQGWTGPYTAFKSMQEDAKQGRQDGSFCLRRDTLGFASPDRRMSFQLEPSGTMDEPRAVFSFRMKFMPDGVKRIARDADCMTFEQDRDSRFDRRFD